MTSARLFSVGRAVPFHVARDPVSLPVLRRWCDAMGVVDAVHIDPILGARSQFGQVVAPLTMLDVWTKPGLAYERDLSDPQGAAFDLLDRDGFTSAMAVSSELIQERPLVLGDAVRSTLVLEAVSPQKSTAVGAAHFVTTRQDFSVDGEAVGHARFVVMKFRPCVDVRHAPSPASDEATAPRERSHADVARDGLGTVVATGLRVLETIPSVDIPITTTLIVAGALATSDYFDAHHDRDAAVRRGLCDVFMNIHTSLGLVERCISSWLGPNATWRSITTRLGVPSFPGDVMTIAAQVMSVDDHSGATSIAFRVTNSLGVHAEGTIGVVLPT